MTAKSEFYTFTILFQSLRNEDFLKKPRHKDKSKILWWICVSLVSQCFTDIDSWWAVRSPL
jgi:hypothetical protein